MKTKRLYIVRSVDLLTVAKSDVLVSTKKEGEELISNKTKIDSYVDMLIRITVNECDYWLFDEGIYDLDDLINDCALLIEILKAQKYI